MNYETFFRLALGLAGLVWGADVLVRGASQLARSVGVSSLVIGLTVVAFGTSAPELSISVLSLLKGQADISVGNIVGSNIANILLILGSSALVAPLVVSTQLIRLDVPVMIGSSLLVFLLSFNGKLGRVEGAALIIAGVLYTLNLLRLQKRQVHSDGAHRPKMQAHRGAFKALIQVAMILAGLVLLVWGADWLVDAATIIARSLGVSELVIGLTVIAGGTSLPELATSLIAAFRGARDIAIGNVIGSCILNLLMVLGVAGIVAPNGIPLNPAVLAFDMPVMIAASVACLPIFFTGHRIARWEGALFFGYYIAYTVFLILSASRHDTLPVFSRIMIAFVIPLTAITLLILVMHAVRIRRPEI